ncbi:sigma 54-interacting transcriptional regulator [Alkalihalobacterium sp. APHAB7]
MKEQYDFSRGEKMQTVMNQMPFGLIMTSNQGLITFANQKASAMLSQNFDKLLNKTILSIIPGSNAIKAIKTNQPFLSSIKKCKQEAIILFEQGIVDVDGEKNAISFLFDTSLVEHLAFQTNKINELKQELDLIMSLVGELVTIADGRGNILRVNEACERIMGVSQKDFIGKPMDFLVNEKIIDQSSTRKVIEEGRNVTIVQTTKSGRRLLVSGYPIFNEEGDLTKVINISKDITETDKLTKKLEETKSLVEHYQVELEKKDKNKDRPLVKSKMMEDTYDLVRRVADVESTVLLLGESGVGKEVLARTLHESSSRRNRPFIKVNCGAIPETLMESELFGYSKGTFTGAHRDGKQGLILAANKGTLFLDEIGEMPLNLQVKLLQVLQEKQVTPLGSTTPIDVDVRFVAATNRDLEEMVERKLFRNDLYYRLNIIPIQIPSLRERRDEIPFLAEHFLKRYNQKYAKWKFFGEGVLDQLMDYTWPGNVRELQNTIERLVVTVSSDEISFNHIPEKIIRHKYSKEYLPDLTLKDAVFLFEKELIENTLKDCVTLKEASKILGVDPSTLTRKVRKFNIKIAETQ